jgi:hypothetical protein
MDAETHFFSQALENRHLAQPFLKSSAERAIWNASGLHIAEDDVANKWVPAVLLGKLAEDRDDDGYLKDINTDQTARDMLRIVEAHNRTKIQYWGIS